MFDNRELSIIYLEPYKPMYSTGNLVAGLFINKPSTQVNGTKPHGGQSPCNNVPLGKKRVVSSGHSVIILAFKLRRIPLLR